VREARRRRLAVTALLRSPAIFPSTRSFYERATMFCGRVDTAKPPEAAAVPHDGEDTRVWSCGRTGGASPSAAATPTPATIIELAMAGAEPHARAPRVAGA